MATESQLETPTLAAFVRKARDNYKATPTAAKQRLSRTKLAADAGLSAGYIIKIEQGLTLRPSDAALGKIANALHLNPAERDHLFALAHMEPSIPSDESGSLTGQERLEYVTKVTADDRNFLDSLNPNLAAYVDVYWNVLYGNKAYFDAFPGLEEHENVLTWFFHCPEARHIMVEWEAEAQLTVDWFRSFMAAYPNDAACNAVFESCDSSPDFVRMWNAHNVIDNRAHPEKILRDKDTGDIYALTVRLWRPPSSTERHTLYTAVPAARVPQTV